MSVTMPNPSKCIAIIPARGGSKGLPKKNLYPLCGLPLIHYSITAASQSHLFEQVVVSSDDPDILSYAESNGAYSLMRPNTLAGDTSPTDPVIEHCIESLDLTDQDILCLLQPTSPLRTAEHIQNAMTLYNNNKPKAVIAVTQPDKTPYKAYKLDDNGFLVGIVGPEYPYTPRQLLPDTFYPNGALYIFSVEDFLAKRQIPREALIPFLMPREESVDVDTQDDIAMIETILRSRKDA